LARESTELPFPAFTLKLMAQTSDEESPTIETDRFGGAVSNEHCDSEFAGLESWPSATLHRIPPSLILIQKARKALPAHHDGQNSSAFSLNLHD
jgi:hypothetical protein